jgi:hypothetical protein
MKNAAPLLISILLFAGGTTGYYQDRPADVWGTVSFIDPVAHRVDLDYVDHGNHQTRSYHYDEHSTKWNNLHDSDVKKGDEITIHGHQGKDQWEAETVSPHQHDQH